MKTIKQRTLALIAIILSTVLVGCGGGAGGVGTVGVVGANTAKLSLGVKTTGTAIVSTNAMSAGETVKAAALFTDVSSAPLSNAIVTFSIGSSALANLGVPSGQTTTDSAGLAYMDIVALNPNTGGVITVSASALKNGVTATATDWIINVASAAGSNTALATSLEISTSASQLASNGATSAIISVTAKNANNAVVPDVSVNFKANSGNLQIINARTDLNGVAKAVVSVGANKANRIITVDAASGAVSTSVDVDVKGTVMSITGPSAIAINSPVQLIGTLKDSNGNPIVNETIGFASTLGNGSSRTCVPVSCKTDSGGTVTVTYTPTVGGLDTVAFSALNASATQTVTAANSQITITATPDTGSSITNEFSIGQTAKPFTISMVGPSSLFPATVNLSSTAGLLSAASVVIPTSGAQSTVTMRTGTSVGQGIVYAQHAVTGGVSNTFGFEIVSRQAASVTLQASPNVIPANAAGSTSNQADVTATAFDSTGNPVKGVSVTFSLGSNASGGSLLSAIAVTNSAGIASTSYIAGPSPASGTGVNVLAAVSGVSPSSAVITVAQQALFVNFGFGNKLIVPNTTTYEQEFSVTVTDAAGRGVAGANVSVALKAGRYYKGLMLQVAVAPSTTPSRWGQNITATCANEDVNHNGTIQAGEDLNSNGRLEPGVRPIVSQVSGGTKANTTDATGFAMYKMSFLKADALWSEYEVTVATATVNGDAQGVAKQTYLLKVLADDVKDVTIPPPNESSPFGVNASCTSTM